MASEKSAEVMAKEAAEFIQKLAPGFTPKVALTLGSGCGDVANEIVPVCTVEYGKLPGFPVSSVQGHAGVLILGHLAGVGIAPWLYAKMHCKGLVSAGLPNRYHLFTTTTLRASPPSAAV